MKATLLLADAAQEFGGKVSALGAGWNHIPTPTPPIALVILVDCPWDQTNKKHKFVIDLVDQDGQPVSFQNGPMGNPLPAFQVEAEFEAGRPPGALPGSPQRSVLTLTMGPGIPLTPGQTYEFRLTVDGAPVDSWLSTFTAH